MMSSLSAFAGSRPALGNEELSERGKGMIITVEKDLVFPNNSYSIFRTDELTRNSKSRQIWATFETYDISNVDRRLKKGSTSLEVVSVQSVESFYWDSTGQCTSGLRLKVNHKSIKQLNIFKRQKHLYDYQCLVSYTLITVNDLYTVFPELKLSIPERPM